MSSEKRSQTKHRYIKVKLKICISTVTEWDCTVILSRLSYFPSCDHRTKQKQKKKKKKFVLVLKAVKQQQIVPPTQQGRRKRTCGRATSEATVVSRLFEGQLSYMTVCLHCEHQAHSTQAFTILSLPIPRDTRCCSIQVAHVTAGGAVCRG